MDAETAEMRQTRNDLRKALSNPGITNISFFSGANTRFQFTQVSDLSNIEDEFIIDEQKEQEETVNKHSNDQDKAQETKELHESQIQSRIYEKFASDSSQIDIEKMEEAYVNLLKYRADFVPLINRSIRNCAETLTEISPLIDEPQSLRVFLVLWIYPMLGTVSMDKAIDTFSLAVLRLPSAMRDILMKWIARDVPKHIFASRMIKPLMTHLENAVHLLDRSDTPRVVATLAQTLGILYRINSTCQKVPHTDFHSHVISDLPMQILANDFVRWVQDPTASRSFTICSHAFLLTADAKRRILQAEAQFKMRTQIQNAITMSLFTGGNLNEAPYFVLRIRRDHLLHDTLVQISSASPQDVQKPLKIVFAGEEGVDAGGVTKEFFQLLVTQLFDINYAMFAFKDDTRIYW